MLSPPSEDRSCPICSTLTIVDRWMRTKCSGSSFDSRLFMVSRNRWTPPHVEAHVVAGRLAPFNLGGANEMHPSSRSTRRRSGPAPRSGFSQSLGASVEQLASQLAGAVPLH